MKLTIEESICPKEIQQQRLYYFSQVSFDAFSQILEADDVYRVMKFYFDFEVTLAAIEACHPLRKKFISGGVVAPVIVIFVSFCYRHEFYGRL